MQHRGIPFKPADDCRQAPPVCATSMRCLFHATRAPCVRFTPCCHPIMLQIWGLFGDPEPPSCLARSIASFKKLNPNHTHILWGPQDMGTSIGDVLLFFSRALFAHAQPAPNSPLFLAHAYPAIPIHAKPLLIACCLTCPALHALLYMPRRPLTAFLTCPVPCHPVPPLCAPLMCTLSRALPRLVCGGAPPSTVGHLQVGCRAVLLLGRSANVTRGVRGTDHV